LDSWTAGARRHARRLLSDYWLQPQVRDQHAARPPTEAQSGPQAKRRRYSKAFQNDLGVLWEAAGYICAERLQPFLPDLLQLLEKHRQLSPRPETRALLLATSTSTISRNLAQLRRQVRWPQRTLRPPSRLRREVPIRVRNWRQEGQPGYLEVDLVSHSGPWATGDWIYTLSATDLETGWSELLPVMTKCQREVLAGLARLHRQLPFPLLGLHIDNGFEFLNAALIDYCRGQQVELSRGRPFHSDDNRCRGDPARPAARRCPAESCRAGAAPGSRSSAPRGGIFSDPSTTASSR
jgi:hypothetical protein